MMEHQKRDVLCIGGRWHGQTVSVEWPVYSNTGGFGQRSIDVQGKSYLIETLFAADGSHVSYLRCPSVRIPDANTLLFNLAKAGRGN